VRDHSEVFVAFDTSKLRNAVAIAEAGRSGEVRFLGEIDNTPAATNKLVIKLAARYQRLWFCYEAGPTGYGLYRQIAGLGHACMVVAPSLIPKKAGDRVKTNRRDALGMVTQFRAGELTAVWVPDPRHEAMRDLTRARGAAVEDLRAKRQHVSSFLLRLGLHYPGDKTWTKTHMTWLVKQKLEHAEQRIAFEEMLLAVRQAQERIGRLEEAIRGAVPDWSLAAVVEALMAMRGIDLVSATAFLAEIGDLSRFRSPRELMAYLGLVPSEHSTGDKVKRGGITKQGNRISKERQ
jgi:transposase